MPSETDASATSQSTFPVAGSCTGNVAPLVAGVHLPPMNNSLVTASTTLDSVTVLMKTPCSR